MQAMNYPSQEQQHKN